MKLPIQPPRKQNQIAANHGIRIDQDASVGDPAGNDQLAGAKALATPTPGTQIAATADLAFDTTSVNSDADLYTVSLTGGVDYAMCTHNLTSGADTVIELMDASATTVMASNDNANGQSYALFGSCGSFGGATCPANDDTLASSLNVSPTVDTDYVIRVRRSTAPPPSAGLFGNYNLTVTTIN